jgi:hypothetical protein
MSYIISKAELEYRTEAELRAMYHNILTELAKKGLSIQDRPMTRITLENIQYVLAKKRNLKPHF